MIYDIDMMVYDIEIKHEMIGYQRNIIFWRAKLFHTSAGILGLFCLSLSLSICLSVCLCVLVSKIERKPSPEPCHSMYSSSAVLFWG